MSSGIQSESTATVTLGGEDRDSVLVTDTEQLQTVEAGGSGEASKRQKMVAQSVLDACRSHAGRVFKTFLGQFAETRESTAEEIVRRISDFPGPTEMSVVIADEVGRNAAKQALSGRDGKMTEVPIPYQLIWDSVRQVFVGYLKRAGLIQSKKPR
jgi:hypothetical protein